MQVEIVATSVQSAINAEKAGADRIELCSELAVGGITPSFGLIREVLERISLPVYVLIRPRSGNFVYSDEEFEVMKKDIEICRELGCKGIVSGILMDDFRVNLARTKELIDQSKPLEFTFHRAFDLTPDPVVALHELIQLKVNRILSSGQALSAEKGIDLLVELKEISKGKLVILPGGGIHPTNAPLFKEKGLTEIHASASSVFSEKEAPKISMNSEKFLDETKVYVSDQNSIKQLVQVCKVDNV